MVAGLRMNNTNAFAAFDKMEEKVMAMEAEAESVGILAAPDSLEAKFAKLEGGSGVDDDLAALKRGLLAAPKEARSGSNAALAARPAFDDVIQRGSAPVMSEIDAELEALRKRARS